MMSSLTLKLAFLGLTAILLVQCEKRTGVAGNLENAEDVDGGMGVTVIHVQNMVSDGSSKVSSNPFGKVSDKAKRLFYMQAYEFLIVDRLLSSWSSVQGSLSRTSRIIPDKYQDLELNGVLFDFGEKIWSDNEYLHRILIDDGWIFFEGLPLFCDYQGVLNIQVSSQELPVVRRAAVLCDGGRIDLQSSSNGIYLKFIGHEFSRFWDGKFESGQAVVFIVESQSEKFRNRQEKFPQK